MRNAKLIDDLDSRIIEGLQSDGRLPNTAIARRLGVAEATVRNRIERMLRNGVIQIGAWADPLKIGYQIYAIIELQVTLRDIEKVAERLTKLREIFFLGTCLGHFDIFAAALFRSNEHLHTFLTKQLCRIPGIERASTTSLTRILKREYRYPLPATTADHLSTDGLDPTGVGRRRRGWPAGTARAEASSGRRRSLREPRRDRRPAAAAIREDRASTARPPFPAAPLPGRAD